MKYKITYYPSHSKHHREWERQEEIVEGTSKFNAAFHWHHRLAQFKTQSHCKDTPVIYSIDMVE